MFDDVTELLVSREYNMKLLYYVCVHIIYQSDVVAMPGCSMYILVAQELTVTIRMSGLTHS